MQPTIPDFPGQSLIMEPCFSVLEDSLKQDFGPKFKTLVLVQHRQCPTVSAERMQNDAAWHQRNTPVLASALNQAPQTIFTQHHTQHS